MLKIYTFLILFSFSLRSDFFKNWSEWNAQNRAELVSNFTPKKSNDNSKKNNQQEDNNKKIRFNSIVGGVSQEVLELKSFLENPELFDEVGAEKPTGILLVGPPGTGKTMTVQALANEIDAEFIQANASSFINMYVGTGPNAVQEIFKKAEAVLKSGKKKHVIIFLDEFDSIGSRRSDNGSGAVSEENKTINELLAQMDGFNKNKNITVIAATNRLEMIDEALLRPGRFDYIVQIPLPDLNKRKELIRHYLKSKPRKMDENIMDNLDTLAKATVGFNCAQLKELVNRASVIAVRNKRAKLTLDDLNESLKQLQ